METAKIDSFQSGIRSHQIDSDLNRRKPLASGAKIHNSNFTAALAN